MRLIMVWGRDKASAIARAEQMIRGLGEPRVFRKDVFDAVVAEDIDRGQSLSSRGEAFAVVLQVDA